jgi:hypothetical protein
LTSQIGQQKKTNNLNKQLKQKNMKKVILSVAVVAAFLSANNAKAQLLDEQNVTVTMDLQPILQLGMNGATNIDFVFDQISEYVGGITQYGATNLTVSSTVSWELYAAAFSSNAAAGSLIWDNQVVYGQDSDPNSTTTLPLTLLELHQDKVNTSTTGSTGGATVDYSLPFSATTGNNNVYATTAPYSRPSLASKYIAGGNSNGAFIVGGSYLILTGGLVGQNSNYSYTMDYRILPGLPAIFPNASSLVLANGGNNTNDGSLNAAGGNTAAYAQPGVYTANVIYVLIEN